MEFHDLFGSLLRWAHIVAGILWIGLLYFFNWVNGPFAATMDGDTKKKVIPELAPRALFFFRWGAAWTALTGLVMLAMVYWMGGLMFESATSEGWNGMSIAAVIFVFLAPQIYDRLAMSPLAKNPKVFAAIMFILVVGVICFFVNVAGFSYRAYVIHTGVIFGATMAMNVWMRIWPSQKKIINGIKTGPPADAAVVALAGTRSKHNTYMSIPLVWMMINAHTAVPAANSWLWLPAMILVGWGAAWMMYKKAAKVKGM